MLTLRATVRVPSTSNNAKACREEILPPLQAEGFACLVDQRCCRVLNCHTQHEVHQDLPWLGPSKELLYPSFLPTEGTLRRGQLVLRTLSGCTASPPRSLPKSTSRHEGEGRASSPLSRLSSTLEPSGEGSNCDASSSGRTHHLMSSPLHHPAIQALMAS